MVPTMCDGQPVPGWHAGPDVLALEWIIGWTGPGALLWGMNDGASTRGTRLYPGCTPVVSLLYPVCIPVVPQLYPDCTPVVPRLYAGYNRIVPPLYPGCTRVRGGGGGHNCPDSTRSCRTSYQDVEEMSELVRPKCLFSMIS